MSEPRKTIDCAFCGKPFTWQKSATAGEKIDTLEAFGADVCPRGLAHVACAELHYTREWLDEYRTNVILGIVPGPTMRVQLPGVVIKTAKMEWIKP